MEIVKNFGLDPIIFGAQIINFLIVFYLLKRFLYKPILEILRKRENEIKEGLKQAEEGKQLLEKTLEKEKEILRRAREDGRKMIDEAKNQAILMSSKIEDDSKKHAERIIESAREQINIETKEAEKRLTVKVSELSLEFLSRSLKQMFSEKEQSEVLEKALKQFRQ